jgi:hypothetical protein
MRLSSVMFAAVLLCSSAVLAQHSSTSSAPSSPPAAPASSPSPASSSSSSSSASSFHSAPSSPSPASPPSFSSSSSSSMSSHASSAPATSISEPAASRSTAQTNEARPSEPHVSEAAPERVTPGAKIGSEEKIAPSSRIGERPADKEKQEKEKYPRSPESDLRRPICKDGPCKEVVPKPPVESDLRRPVCKDKPCTCPPGEVLGKQGGCVASNPVNGSDQCGTGQYWNGGACTAIVRACQPNEYWNGVACVNSQTECATINASAALAANEVRAARAQMQSACMDDPSGQECSDLKQSYAGAIERYRMAISGAPANCRAMLPDPVSL